MFSFLLHTHSERDKSERIVVVYDFELALAFIFHFSFLLCSFHSNQYAYKFFCSRISTVYIRLSCLVSRFFTFFATVYIYISSSELCLLLYHHRYYYLFILLLCAHTINCHIQHCGKNEKRRKKHWAIQCLLSLLSAYTHICISISVIKSDIEDVYSEQKQQLSPSLHEREKEQIIFKNIRAFIFTLFNSYTQNMDEMLEYDLLRLP